MADNRIYNFSAGPSMLPVPVLERCASDMLNYQGSGMSVMEMSHRSKVYDGIITETEAALRRVLSIPDNYKVLFLQGGASTQFAAIPMNLLKTGKADYALTGNFATNAYKEAVKFGDIHVAFSSKVTATSTAFRRRPSWTSVRMPITSTSAPTTPSTAPSISTTPRPRQAYRS